MSGKLKRKGMSYVVIIFDVIYVSLLKLVYHNIVLLQRKEQPLMKTLRHNLQGSHLHEVLSSSGLHGCTLSVNKLRNSMTLHIKIESL
ncbi:hypothetical protein J437_LFUL001889 [Ladona fulva]|uniref:Uncharacterized protein n=1 Tax=Ladona fulva TaxID=123851 RepID=A0A8K0JUY5_LADFU|nr:hypothetical protein J437_LFUL001889 [Ladona fulva]